MELQDYSITSSERDLWSHAAEFHKNGTKEWHKNSFFFTLNYRNVGAGLMEVGLGKDGIRNRNQGKIIEIF